MQTHTQRRRRARGPVSGGIEAFSAGKPETGFELPGATLTPQSHPAVHPTGKSAFEQALLVATEPETTCAFATETAQINAIGLSSQARREVLDQHLLRPFAHPTEFYLIDLIDRLTGESERYADLQELMTHAAQPENICTFRLGMVLSAAVRAGALEKLGTQSGREGSYRITAIGKRYLEQAKAMRVALWKINPLLTIGEICAIVQVEGGDTLSEMITQVKDEEAIKAKSRRREKAAARQNAGTERNAPAAAQKPAPDAATAIENGPPPPIQIAIHPLWAGLAAPLQNQSYPRP